LGIPDCRGTNWLCSQRILRGVGTLPRLGGYGCKLGKEGYAAIASVSDEPIQLECRTAAHPSTILPTEPLLQSGQFAGCDIYNLYRYNWAADAQTSSDEEGFLDQNPSSVQGFVPFVAAYFPIPLIPP